MTRPAWGLSLALSLAGVSLAGVSPAGGCAWRRSDAVAADPLAVPLSEADALWLRRAEDGGLDRAIAAYEALLASPDRRVLHRLARAHWTAGLVAEALPDAEDQLETARGYAIDCLSTFPEFAIGAQSGGWRPRAEAVSGLPPQASGCLGWGAAASLLLVERRGPGAALEVEQAAPLAERALVLAPEGEEGVIAWAAAMAVILDQDPLRTTERAARLGAARALLHSAIDINPENLYFQVSLTRAFPEGGASLFPEAAAPLAGGGAPEAERGVWALENAAARRLAASP